MVITRSAFLLSAVVGAALGAGFEISGPRAENSTAAATVTQRFPLPSETFTAVPVTYFVAAKFTAAQKAAAVQKANRPPVSQFCAMTPHGWPYVSHECRVAAVGMTFMPS